MADTKRTITDLLTNLFQDGQSSGAITPQDMRDLIETMRTQWGGLYVSSSADTTISGAGTYVKAAGTTTLWSAVSPVGFDMPTDNRLRYTGTPTKDVLVFCSASVSAAGAATNKQLGLQLRDNDGLITGTTATGWSGGTTAKATNIVSMAVFEAETNDYVEAWVANIDSTDNVTVDDMIMFGIALTS